MIHEKLLHLGAIFQLKQSADAPHECEHEQTAQVAGAENTVFFFAWNKTFQEVNALHKSKVRCEMHMIFGN